jgi:hypothetical protein
MLPVFTVQRIGVRSTPEANSLSRTQEKRTIRETRSGSEIPNTVPNLALVEAWRRWPRR